MYVHNCRLLHTCSYFINNYFGLSLTFFMCALTAHEHSLPADHHQVSPVGTPYINMYRRTACSTSVYEGTGDCSLLGTWISCFIWFCLPALFKLAGSDTFKCFTLERHVHVLFKDFLVS